MAATQHLWEVTLKPSFGCSNTYYMTTRTRNIVIVGKEIEKLTASIQKDFTSILQFEQLRYMGTIGK